MTADLRARLTALPRYWGTLSDTGTGEHLYVRWADVAALLREPPADDARSMKCDGCGDNVQPNKPRSSCLASVNCLERGTGTYAARAAAPKEKDK